jgi:hypothetical protein
MEWTRELIHQLLECEAAEAKIESSLGRPNIKWIREAAQKWQIFADKLHQMPGGCEIYNDLCHYASLFNNRSQDLYQYKDELIKHGEDARNGDEHMFAAELHQAAAESLWEDYEVTDEACEYVMDLHQEALEAHEAAAKSYSDKASKRACELSKKANAATDKLHRKEK